MKKSPTEETNADLDYFAVREARLILPQKRTAGPLTIERDTAEKGEYRDVKSSGKPYKRLPKSRIGGKRIVEPDHSVV